MQQLWPKSLSEICTYPEELPLLVHAHCSHCKIRIIYTHTCGKDLCSFWRRCVEFPWGGGARSVYGIESVALGRFGWNWYANFVCLLVMIDLFWNVMRDWIQSVYTCLVYIWFVCVSAMKVGWICRNRCFSILVYVSCVYGEHQCLSLLVLL